MRRLLLLTVCFLTASVLFAGPVTKEQAQQQARQFLQGRVAAGHNRAAANAHVDLSGEVSGLYVFNVAGDNGYVIVSNDDVAFPVLGYADSGSFDMNNIPENMKMWLQGYADEIAWAKSHGVKKASDATAHRAGGVKSPIGPLMVTLWDQGEPFNNQTPYYGVKGGYYVYGETPGGDWDPGSAEHCVTGCAATAMAQVMYYNQWPAGPISKAIPAYSTDLSENSVRVPLTSPLPVVTFDWANMQATYSGGESSAQKDAVARLMHYCGCSIRMNYGPSSGATTSSVADALKEYFDYSSTVDCKSRGYHSYADWIEMIYHELSEGRVVLYFGQSTGGGHAFVCDGYQSEDYFHVNWGWGGSSNGNFKLSAMSPSEQGAGGSSSSDGYNYLQGAIVGIQKNGGTGTVLDLANAPSLTFNSISLSPSTIALGETTNVTINVTNNGTKDYDSDIYVYANGGVRNGKAFLIPQGATRDCVIPYTPSGFTGTVYVYATTPSSTGGAYFFPSGPSASLKVTSGDGASTNVDMTLAVSALNAEGATSPYDLYGNHLNATVRVTNSTSTNYSGKLYWQILEESFSGSFSLEEININVPKNSHIDVALPALTLDPSKNYDLYTSYNKNGTKASVVWTHYNLRPAIMSYQADGTVVINKPGGTSLDVSTSEALAFNVAGTGITSITPNSKPNAVYIYSGSKPSGLDGKNVIKYDAGSYTAETIALTDGNEFYSPVDFTADEVTFNYTFTVGANGSKGWNTIMLPFDVTKVTADGVTIDWFHSGSDTGKQFWLKEFTSDDASNVYFNYVSGNMKANTPYIVAFPGDKWGSEYDLSSKAIKFVGQSVTVHEGKTLSSVTGSNYRFIGSSVQNNTANIYCINGDGNGFELKATGGSAPFRAFFKPGIFDSTVTSLGIGSDTDGNTTGINDVQFEKNSDGQYYNLNGQRISQPKKGLYIKNGKKYIVK